MCAVGYDNLPVNFEQVLSLPMREATGVAADPTQDVARPHHTTLLVGPPTWAQHAVSNLTYMVFTAGDSLTLPQAGVVDPTDMNFRTGSITGGFTFMVWLYGTNLGAINTVFCYGGATDGYRIAISTLGVINFITNQAGPTIQGTSTAEAVFTINNWWFVAVTCDGAWDTASALIYRNAIDETLVTADHISPDTPAARDFYVGAQDDQTGPPGAPELSFIGNMWNPRCSTRQLPQTQIQEIFEMERALFNI